MTGGIIAYCHASCPSAFQANVGKCVSKIAVIKWTNHIRNLIIHRLPNLYVSTWP